MRRIVSICVVLCLITACGVTNHKKFNPQYLNGLYGVGPLFDIQDSSGNYLNQLWYTLYIKIDYPSIHTCYDRYNSNKDSIDQKIKKM